MCWGIIKQKGMGWENSTSYDVNMGRNMASKSWRSPGILWSLLNTFPMISLIDSPVEEFKEDLFALIQILIYKQIFAYILPPLKKSSGNILYMPFCTFPFLLNKHVLKNKRLSHICTYSSASFEKVYWILLYIP